jgi:hypothetical protein
LTIAWVRSLASQLTSTAFSVIVATSVFDVSGGLERGHFGGVGWGGSAVVGGGVVGR